MLCDDKILDCKKAPLDSGLQVHAKIQNLVYLAMHFGCPELDYKYRSFNIGPHSPTLTNDLYGIGVLDNTKPIDNSTWPRLDKFRRFVHEHDRGDGLMVAATILELRDKFRDGKLFCQDKQGERECVIETFASIYPLIDRETIASMYDKISDELIAVPLSA